MKKVQHMLNVHTFLCILTHTYFLTAFLESVAIVNWRDRRWTELLDAMLQQQYLTDGEKYQDARVVRWIQKLVVDPKNLEKGMEARLDYNYFAKMISTKGIQLFDTKTTSYKNEKNDVALYSNDLIPLKGMQFNVSKLKKCRKTKVYNKYCPCYRN